MDFVVGYEIKLSGNHNCKGVPAGRFSDICDTLAGKYPQNPPNAISKKLLSLHTNMKQKELQKMLLTGESVYLLDDFEEVALYLVYENGITKALSIKGAMK